MLDISIIIPAYRAEKIIEQSLKALLAYLDGKTWSYEIIVVDDGSKDATDKIVESFDNDYVRLISLADNEGKGAAVQAGMLAAKGKCRIFTDVDLPYDLRAIEIARRLINEQNFDVVVGDRTLKGSSYYENLSWLRYCYSRIFAFLVRVLVAGEMFDTQCGFKAFKGELAWELFSLMGIKGFAFDVEILYIALKYNLAIRRIPVLFKQGTYSSVQAIKHAIRMIFDILSLPVKWHLGRYKSSELERQNIKWY